MCLSDLSSFRVVLPDKISRQLVHWDDGIAKYLHEALERRKSGKADERELARKCRDETMTRT